VMLTASLMCTRTEEPILAGSEWEVLTETRDLEVPEANLRRIRGLCDSLKVSNRLGRVVLVCAGCPGRDWRENPREKMRRRVVAGAFAWPPILMWWTNDRRMMRVMYICITID
jgi:hypothetical protein